jgi:hypothetical protein
VDDDQETQPFAEPALGFQFQGDLRAQVRKTIDLIKKAGSGA